MLKVRVLANIITAFGFQEGQNLCVLYLCEVGVVQAFCNRVSCCRYSSCFSFGLLYRLFRSHN